jgi:large subunit ribosomal protein L30
MSEVKKVRVTLVKSLAGRTPRQRACVAGLGLRRLHKSRELEDTAAVRGMIRRVAFMLRVEEVQP